MGFGKDGTGVILRRQDTKTLGTLTAGQLNGIGSLGLQKDFRLLKLEVRARVEGLTAAEGGQLALALVNGELTGLEAQEALQADGPLDRSDATKAERAARAVWIGACLEIDHEDGTAGGFTGAGDAFGIVTFKPRWTFSEVTDFGVSVWNMYNTLSTGAVLYVNYTAYGVWV